MITLNLASRQFIELVDSELDGSILGDNHSTFLTITDLGIEIGLFQLEKITNECISIHMHILKKFQGKGIALKCLKPLLSYLKNGTIRVLLASVAIENRKMIQVIQKTSFKCCGCIPNGIIYNNKLQDLILFSLEIN